MSSPNHPCRVLHVITDLSSGGAQRMLSHLVMGRRKSPEVEHEVVSLTGRGVYAEAFERAGVSVTCLRLRGFAGLPRALWRLVRIVRGRRPDVVQTWLYHADFLGSAASWLTNTPARLVWNLRCSDMDLQRYAWTTRFLVRLLARLSPGPAAVIVNSRAGQDWHARLGYKPRRWLIVPNGFPTESLRVVPDVRSRMRAELSVPDHATLFACAARVDPMKDHGNLLEAFARVRQSCHETRLILIGRGTELDEGPLSRLNEDPKLAEAVLRFGEVTENYSAFLQACDVLVLPSAFGEGLPNVLGEAMCLERPCITTDVGDAAILVGNTGRVVPPRSPAALAAAMQDLAAMPAADRDKLGRRARRRIVRDYNLRRIVETYDSVYLDLADRCLGTGASGVDNPGGTPLR